MKPRKVAYVIVGVLLGLILTTYFVVVQILHPSLENIIYYVTFLCLIEGIWGYFFYRMKHQAIQEKEAEIQKFKQKGIILKDTEDGVDIVLEEVDKLKKELAFKESQLSFMMSYTGQGILLINKDKEIIYSNGIADDLMHLVNTKNNSYIVKIRYADIKTQIDKCFEKAELISSEYMIDHKILSVKTIPTGNKNDLHILLLVDDMSEKVNLQNIKKDFFNFAGHELKTPITILKGYAELLYHQIVTGDESIEIAGKMIKQTEVMTAFVDDMLMLSRLETQTDTPLIDVDLNHVLNEAIEKFDFQAKEKQVLIRVYAENIVYKADPIDMEKLFKNLVENAIKYNKEKGTVDIRLEKQTNKVVFTILDSGLGIEKEEIQRIFERFYRVNQMRNIPGTGLGLSIVKHIVSKYHGSIDVDSEINKYTKFTIII